MNNCPWISPGLKFAHISKTWECDLSPGGFVAGYQLWIHVWEMFIFAEYLTCREAIDGNGFGIWTSREKQRHPLIYHQTEKQLDPFGGHATLFQKLAYSPYIPNYIPNSTIVYQLYAPTLVLVVNSPSQWFGLRDTFRGFTMVFYHGFYHEIWRCRIK